MGKVISFFTRTSIKTSFVSYIFICLCAALLLSLASLGLCQLGREQINRKYRDKYYEMAGTQGQIVLEDGSEVDGAVTFYTEDIGSLYSDTEELIYNILGILNFALIPVWFVLCIGITSILFYRRILQKPLRILDSAADKITANNLDFTITYDRQDEMGKLCLSFEKMRAALQDNHLEMWRQMEERKRLNAAFSHDLRTPLTVLKGQSDMLLKYVPDGKMTTEKIAAIAGTMKVHCIRLEDYVSTMNTLQRLEDIDIKKSDVAKGDMIKQLRECSGIICADIKVFFDTEGLIGDFLHIDLSLVMQVYENLLSNAVRFAKSSIMVKLAGDHFLTVTVSDDGQGFSEKDLSEATNPFYKSEDGAESQHFGMGLNICKILCEKHGGALLLSNHKEGASVKAVFCFIGKCVL